MPALLPLLSLGMPQGPPAPASPNKEAATYKAGAFEPNYATKMLSPVRDILEEPRLYPARMVDTINVAIIDDGYYCNANLSDVAKSACEAWSVATKSIPEGGLHFNYRITSSPIGADIVFVFGSPDQFKGYDGYTAEYGTYALVRLAAVNLAGEPANMDRVRRIATHEVGHALGIWGHSPNKQDVMSLDEDTKTISIADINTLRMAYRKPAGNVKSAIR